MSRLRDRNFIYETGQLRGISFNKAEKPIQYVVPSNHDQHHVCCFGEDDYNQLSNDSLLRYSKPLLLSDEYEFDTKRIKKLNEQQRRKYRQDNKEKLNYVVFILIVTFSIASWIDMVGVFAELPLMVPVLPEGWNLSVYFCLSIEIPFIAPVIIYIMILRKPSIISFRAAILFIISVGILSLILLAKYWSKTVFISGKERSVPLLVLVTCLGLVDSCSTVVFYPYMKRYNPSYMSAVLVGESLTGFIPAILKLVQGGAEPMCVKEEPVVNTTSDSRYLNASDISTEYYSKPRFSVSIYILLLAFIMVICLVAFLLLELHPRLRNMQLPKPSKQIRDSVANSSSQDYKSYGYEQLIDRRKLSRFEYANFMIIMGISAFVLWGLISAFYTYSILPFGFKVTNNAIIITNAIRFSAVFIAYKRPVEQVMYLNFIMVFLLCASMYMLVCAVFSPCPPLINTTSGAFLASFCLISVDYFSTYMRSCIIRRISFHGGNILVTCAMITKFGVLLGAIVSTSLVQKTNLFLARRFCSPLSDQCQDYRSRFLPAS